jgi:hypothetical protein
MLRCGLGLGANFCNYILLLSLSCYKLACHYFLYLRSNLCTHTCHISCILLLCSDAQKMKNSLIMTSSRHAGPGHLSVL